MAAPPVPTGLAAVAGNHNVALTWNDAAGAVSYDLYRDDVLLTTIAATTFKALTGTDAGSGGDTAALTVTPAGATNPAMNALFDNFDAASLAKWLPQGTTPISGGVLYVPASPSYWGVVSNTVHDLTGSDLRVQVAQAAMDIPAANAYTGVQLYDPATGWGYLMETESVTGNLLLEVKTATYSETSVAYNPAVHCWWRIRHSTTSGNVTLETSVDGTSYTTRRTITAPLPVPITALRAYLYNGYDTGATTPTAAQFDNVNSMATSIQAPTGFLATPVGFRQVTVVWDATTGATSYELWRDGALYQTTTATNSTDTYALGAAGQTHSYFVRAIRATARSNPSITQTVTVTDTVPATPGSFTAIPQTAGSVNLTWTAPSPAPDSYLVGVKRNTDASYSSANDASLDGSRTNWLVTGLPSGVLMNFRIRSERTAASAYVTTNATPN